MSELPSFWSIFAVKPARLPDEIYCVARSQFTVDGDHRVDFRYAEFFNGMTVAQYEPTARFLSNILLLRRRFAGVTVKIVEPKHTLFPLFNREGPWIEVSGVVPGHVFAELMRNEFGYWTRLGQFSRYALAIVGASYDHFLLVREALRKSRT